VITLTRLNGAAFVLNPDLIERIESTPDTVITLVDGKHYMVQEPVDLVVERVQRDRAALLAEVGAYAAVGPETPRSAGPEDGSVIPMRRNH
jgi:flagellar protein FlbD